MLTALPKMNRCLIGRILSWQDARLRTLAALRESEARLRRSEAWFKEQIDLAVDAIVDVFEDASPVIDMLSYEIRIAL